MALREPSVRASRLRAPELLFAAFLSDTGAAPCRLFVRIAPKEVPWVSLEGLNPQAKRFSRDGVVARDRDTLAKRFEPADIASRQSRRELFATRVDIRIQIQATTM